MCCLTQFSCEQSTKTKITRSSASVDQKVEEENDDIQVLKLSKDNAEEGLGELYEYRAKILFEAKKYEAAISDWISAIQVDSSYSGYANYKIGAIYLEGIRDFDQAIKYFSNSLDLNYWQPKYEDGLLWNDKFLKIKWPIKKPFISKKDMKLKTFFQFKKTYKGF